MRRDERALALPADEQILRRERADGLAHRALRHAEARRQRHLGGDRRARRPFAGFERVLEQRFRLYVQRLERRRLRSHSYILYQL
jgi:hypothetical protein